MEDLQQIILDEVRASRAETATVAKLAARLDERTKGMKSDLDELKPEVEKNKTFRQRVYMYAAGLGLGGGSLTTAAAKYLPWLGN